MVNPPSPLWNWKHWDGNPFLTCDLLPQPHGFFTRQFYPLTPESLVEALSSSADVFRVKQVHGKEVLLSTDVAAHMAAAQSAVDKSALNEPTESPFPFADGVMSDRPNQSVWACSADCTPALICDVVTKQVAAVHAGWRGTAKKILPVAVSQMVKQGSQVLNLRVALGPAIEGAVYQVSEAVACEVGATVAPALADSALVDRLLNTDRPPLLGDPENGKVRLDVRRINQMQMIQMGLSLEQVAIAPHCTYQDAENFFSYRRTQEKKVQWAGIVSE